MKPKLNYTKEELIQQGWCTVGGRVEDFIMITKTKGLSGAYEKIKQQYGGDADEVYRGMIVCKNYGPEAYYRRITLDEVEASKKANFQKTYIKKLRAIIDAIDELEAFMDDNDCDERVENDLKGIFENHISGTIMGLAMIIEEQEKKLNNKRRA